jgi:hypothetical protein
LRFVIRYGYYQDITNRERPAGDVTMNTLTRYRRLLSIGAMCLSAGYLTATAMAATDPRAESYTDAATAQPVNTDMATAAVADQARQVWPDDFSGLPQDPSLDDLQRAIDLIRAEQAAEQCREVYGLHAANCQVRP